MNKSTLIILVDKLLISNEDNFENEFEDKFAEVCKYLTCNYEEISSELENIAKYYFSCSGISEWRYLLAVIYVLFKIGNVLKNDNKELLSVKESGIIKKIVASVVKIGIYRKLLPKLPCSLLKMLTVHNDMFYNYNILKCTILAFYDMLNNVDLRSIVLTEALTGMLSGLYQISCCPMKKDLRQICSSNIYEKLLDEKKLAARMLKQLKENIHPNIYVKNTMILFQESSPPWFKKAISQTLTDIMLSPKGIEYVAVAMLTGTGNDQAQNWKALDVLYRLISSCKSLTSFKDNICKQILNLLEEAYEDSDSFERLFVICTKRFYSESVEIGKDIFLRKVMSELLHFTYKGYKFEEGFYTEKAKKNIRLLYAIFVEKTVESDCLPIEIIKPVLAVIFRIYALTTDAALITTNNESKGLLVKYIEQNVDDVLIFDSLLFNINIPQQILPIRSDIELCVEANDIMLKYSEYSVMPSVSENSDALLNLFQTKTQLLNRLFIYLLNCLNNRDKYFKKVNETLLTVENKIMNDYFEISLCVYKLLSTLAENKSIQTLIVESPEEIVIFIKNALEKAKENQFHMRNLECDEFQTLFTIVMVLNALIDKNMKQNHRHFNELITSLKIIRSETKHTELSTLIDQILSNIESQEGKLTDDHIKDTKSQLDVVLEDICDPLLPVRGHGLMALKKLVDKKDASVLHRKQYVLTIFQQNIKNEDSFIYLSAIDGLAAMADIFPDTVLNVLCEEYSDFTKKDKNWEDIRMKLGEVLVRVTKLLGEMAPKYKALLLNTFLNGTKDDDHLVRASALSNLAEICRVLGFKLGTVVTEVLVCVHAIVTTDKAIESRRAAITVIRQLFAGLESEMIEFLKEDILHIYRTLKMIYHDDKDDVMRLQAQLALEELNENMKNYVFPKPELNMEKKIIMLD